MSKNTQYASAVVAVYRLLVPIMHRKYDMVIQKEVDGNKTNFLNMNVDDDDDPAVVATVTGAGIIDIKDADLKSDPEIKAFLKKIRDGIKLDKEPSDKTTTVKESIKHKPLTYLLRENKEVAVEILRQLGGNKFMAMVKVKPPLLYANEGRGSLAFKFTGSPKANYVKITLNGMDTYDVKFVKIHGESMKTVYEMSGIYDDQLQEIFTKVTGLNTRLF